MRFASLSLAALAASLALAAAPAAMASQSADFKRGMAAFDKGDYRGAITAFSSVIAANPREVSAWIDRGDAHYKLGEWDLAAADYRKALALKPDYAVWVSLGNALDNGGNFNDAVVAYRGAIAMNSRKASAWLELGAAQSAQKSYGEAAKSLETAVRLDPRSGRAQKLLGVAYYQLTRLQDAIGPLQKAEKLLPGDIEAPRQLGDVYQDLAKASDDAKVNYRDLSSAAYDRALAIDANDFETLMNKGNLFYNKGDYGAAIAFYRQGVRAEPGSAWAQTYLGDTYYNTGAFSQARAAYDAALAVDGKWTDALKGGARARLQLGDKAGARSMIERLRRIDAKAGEALNKELFP